MHFSHWTRLCLWIDRPDGITGISTTYGPIHQFCQTSEASMIYLTVPKTDLKASHSVGGGGSLWKHFQSFCIISEVQIIMCQIGVLGSDCQTGFLFFIFFYTVIMLQGPVLFFNISVTLKSGRLIRNTVTIKCDPVQELYPKINCFYRQ